MYLLLFDLPLTGLKIGAEDCGAIYTCGVPAYCIYDAPVLKADWLSMRLSFAFESIERSSRRSLEGLRPYFYEMLSTSSPVTGFVVTLFLRAIWAYLPIRCGEGEP